MACTPSPHQKPVAPAASATLIRLPGDPPVCSAEIVGAAGAVVWLAYCNRYSPPAISVSVEVATATAQPKSPAFICAAVGGHCALASPAAVKVAGTAKVAIVHPVPAGHPVSAELGVNVPSDVVSASAVGT